ncbi:MAG: hypothetical protein AB8I08_05155 [Sandaracinaceae bacterium]
MRCTRLARLVHGALLGASLFSMGAFCSGCGDAPVVTLHEPVESPQRTAAQDDAFRRLVMDLAVARACPMLEGRFLPLPENRRERPAGVLPLTEGRLWVRECEVSRRGDQLHIALSGQGWQWVEQSRPGPFGSSFSVRGTVRFQASLALEGLLDVRYDESNHLAMLTVTPAESPTARVVPIGTVPVEPDGGWSGLIAGLGGLFGMNAQAQAGQMLEAEAEATLQRELARGMTFSLDLCTRQLDGSLGALADGQSPPARPYDNDGRPWLENATGRVHIEGLDLSGPWGGDEGPLRVDIAIEEGRSLDVTLLCAEDAEALAGGYLATGVPARPAGLERRTIRASAAGSLTMPFDRCAAPYVLLTTEETHVRYRIRVRRDGPAPEALLDCD